MRYFPIYFDMSKAQIAVIGGSDEAMQKIRLLLKTPAKITVIAPRLNKDLQNIVASDLINWICCFVNRKLLANFDLIYAAADDELNAYTAKLAQALRIPLNVVDEPDLCKFITPAIVDRSPITIAIGSEGTAPVLARKIKTKIEAMLSANIGQLALNANSIRNKVTLKITEFQQRRKFWDHYFEDAFSGLKPSEIHKRGSNLLEQWTSQKNKARNHQGEVILVGAGPGPSDLLTFRAANALQSADVIVYDRLIDASVLEVVRRDAKRIYVGKKPGEPCTTQQTINQILIEEASKGQTVIRLKCGDPLIFGRAGEELAALETAGIKSEIIPGITAATACAAEAKLPLTEREGVRALTYLTGHCTEGLTPYDWSSLAQKGTMLVLYMGVKMAPKIEANLLAVGAKNSTKVTIIENGCHNNMRQISTRLGRLSTDIKRHKISNPAMIYIKVETQNIQADTNPGNVDTKLTNAFNSPAE